ncbi:MAG: hypothetical protein M5U08_25730 [Burkholderiales bacterium]|nr:hypothetical protein [Burkholderiales bacterium]
MPNAAARTATCRAMLPNPTSPSVLPATRKIGLPGDTAQTPARTWRS